MTDEELLKLCEQCNEIAVQFSVSVPRLIADKRELVEALKAQRTLIEDMARFVGKMALKDYALFNDAPLMADRAIAKHGGK